MHFVFTQKTSIKKMYDYDTIGIGSVVQIYWSRSFERIIKGSHIIINIEKMEVYKCEFTFRKEKLFVFQAASCARSKYLSHLIHTQWLELQSALQR